MYYFGEKADKGTNIVNVFGHNFSNVYNPTNYLTATIISNKTMSDSINSIEIKQLHVFNELYRILI